MRRVTPMLLLVAALTAGCSHPQLRMVGDARVLIQAANVSPGSPHSIGTIMLCLTGPGTATITRVALRDPQGAIRVDAFAVRPHPFLEGLDAVGDIAAPLASIEGFDLGSSPDVAAPCPTGDQTSSDVAAPELAVQISLASGDLGGGDELEIGYEIDGRNDTAVIPFGIWLCGATCPDRPDW